ncbi:MAG: DUF1993 domain-containing protein [Myxococcota bacterium]
MFDLAVTQPRKMLKNLDAWLEEAVAYAAERKFDPDTLLQARLYPDMHPLAAQIRAVADSAKLGAARCAGVQAPKHADDETTLTALRARLQEVAAYLEGFERSQIDGQEDRRIDLPFLQGRAARAEDYLREFALPNMHFHLVTAYGILRHCGVLLGKTKYIGGMTLIEE